MPAMVVSGAKREATDPWLVLKANSGDVQVFALCVPEGAAKDLPTKVESVFADTRVVVEIIHRPQGSLESPVSIWRAWIAWRGHARMVNLDVSSVCSGCGRLITNVGINPDGLILVEH